MLLKKVISIGLIFCNLQLTAQSISKDSLINKLSILACEKLSTLTNEELKNSKLDELMEKTLVPIFVKYKNEISEYYDFADKSKKENVKLGRDVGKQLGLSCPVFLKMIVNNPEVVMNYKKKKIVSLI